MSALRRGIRHFLSVTEDKALPAGAFFPLVVDKKLPLTLKAQMRFVRLEKVRRAVFKHTDPKSSRVCKPAWKTGTPEIRIIPEGLQKLLGASEVQSRRPAGQMQSQAPHALQEPFLATRGVSAAPSILAWLLLLLLPNPSVPSSCFEEGIFTGSGRNLFRHTLHFLPSGSGKARCEGLLAMYRFDFLTAPTGCQCHFTVCS